MKRPSQVISTGSSVIASVVLHAVAVLLVFVAPSLFEAHPATWGSRTGDNGGVNVKIVNSVSGIALPTPPVTTEEPTPVESKSIHKPEPEPKAKAPDKADPAAIKLPSKTAPKDSKETKKPVAPTRTASADVPTQNPPNAVPYSAGGGGPAVRYGQIGQGTDPTGAEFAGDGTFGEKYAFYVEAMKRAITESWRGMGVAQQRTPRVYVIFTIDASGQVSNIALENPTTSPTAMERAAMQAVRTAKLPQLPKDYRGPPVGVRFYFDYAK